VAAAVFNWADWSALYPELVAAGVTEQYATALFNGPASLLVDNTDASIITDVGKRTTFLYMAVAHLAKLQGPGSSGNVGRIASASEGSVSVSFDYAGAGANSAFWLQTQYGALYWQVTAPFRTMRYVPGPPSRTALPWPYMGQGYRQPGQW